jgi:hypothetical protein
MFTAPSDTADSRLPIRPGGIEARTMALHPQIGASMNARCNAYRCAHDLADTRLAIRGGGGWCGRKWRFGPSQKRQFPPIWPASARQRHGGPAHRRKPRKPEAPKARQSQEGQKPIVGDPSPDCHRRRAQLFVGFMPQRAGVYFRPFLAEVGRAVVVHPRGRLLRLSRAKGWYVVRPMRPTSGKANATKALSRDSDARSLQMLGRSWDT